MGPFEPISVQTARQYLSAVRAWHLAQGWPQPLSDNDLSRINWSLRGMENLQASKRSRPPHPPITLTMLKAIRASLDLKDPFDACVWAVAACTFWGLMRFGEVTVHSRASFSGTKHLKRKDMVAGRDDEGRPFTKLLLPHAKTAKPGETQVAVLVPQSEVCAVEALQNLRNVVPAKPMDPLFSWRDVKGNIRPLTKTSAMRRIRLVLEENGWNSIFGHSFCIGGASFLLARGVNPEIVRLAGRWKLLAYEVYIRAFEQVASTHMANLRLPGASRH